jgi:hypothetical protein
LDLRAVAQHGKTSPCWIEDTIAFGWTFCHMKV